MKDTTATDMRLNIRSRRADTILHAVMSILHPYLDELGDHRRAAEARGEEFLSKRSLYGEVADKLMKMLHEHGAEIVTDHSRLEAGLPQRGPDGWTAEEMLALEKRRMDALLSPFQKVLVADNVAKTTLT